MSKNYQKYVIEAEDIKHYNRNYIYDFPKYTTQLLNLANQNAQGTRPKIVGQLSELFPKFIEQEADININNWKEWYIDKKPEGLKDASNRIYNQIDNLKKAILLIDKQMVENWVEDLVINKTYNGLYFQEAILASLAKEEGSEYRLSTPNQESQGIDGFVGNEAYSIKPESYRTKPMLQESINAKMIFYDKNKKKNAIVYEVER
jgi:hypothetical protein